MKRIILPVLSILVLLFSQCAVVAADTTSCNGLSQTDCNSLYGDWTNYVPDNGSGQCPGSNIPGSGGAITGGPALDQVKSFAGEPVTSTWNISNSAVEQWFLKQAGAQATIAKYGLNSTNIGQITSAVVAANVSPVFFYLYVVNEGGGAGGFINHYSSDVAGGGPANATRDAQYIASQSQVMDSQPSWIDAGNPVNFVPQAVQDAGNADFKNMPSGTIGRIYIPATAATTWEVYYPNGLLKAYNQVQNYGPTLAEMMQNITSMGGNPLQGGTTVAASGCTGVAGQGITKAINFAVAIANNNGYGYDQATRTSGWTNWQQNPSCTNQCGSFDCSSFIAAALTEAGYFATNPEFSALYEAPNLQQAGFTNVTSSVNLSTGQNLQPGDILLNTASHTAMYIGNSQVVQASINENGGVNGGQVGDQTGNEISVTAYYNFPWDSVWRAPSN